MRPPGLKANQKQGHQNIPSPDSKPSTPPNLTYFSVWHMIIYGVYFMSGGVGGVEYLGRGLPITHHFWSLSILVVILHALIVVQYAQAEESIQIGVPWHH